MSLSAFSLFTPAQSLPDLPFITPDQHQRRRPESAP